eukprot:5321822-Amphidinium_carterae.1
MSSNPDVRVKTAEEIAEEKAQKKQEKRQRQNQQRIAVSLHQCATMGSSDSDGFVPVEMEDARTMAYKANDKEIRRLEKNLVRLKNARLNPNASSTDSEQSVVKMRKSESEEELRQFAAQLPYLTWPYQVSPET